MPTYSFKKEERLKSKKTISRLFGGEGQSFGAYPLRIIWIELEEEEGKTYPVQCAVSVSKRRFSKAVDRNRIKRQLREAWRLNKQRLYNKLPAEKRYAIMLLFTGKEQIPQAQMEKQMQYVIRKFLRKLNEQTPV